MFRLEPGRSPCQTAPACWGGGWADARSRLGGTVDNFRLEALYLSGSLRHGLRLYHEIP